jgi:GxxExxY protein
MLKEPSPDHDEIARQVIGAAIEVHRELGPGFIEGVYESALQAEFELRGIPYKQQLTIGVEYKGLSVGEGRPDFLVHDAVVVELKAVEALHPVHTAQVISYLKAAKLQLGLLINFNVPLLKSGIKRIVLSS